MLSTRTNAEPVAPASGARTVLSVQDLSVQFKLPHGWVTAVDRVSFDLKQGEIAGIVGESGSGKSQILLSLMGLLASNGRCIGDARFEGQPLLNRPPKELDSIRGFGGLQIPGLETAEDKRVDGGAHPCLRGGTRHRRHFRTAHFLERPIAAARADEFVLFFFDAGEPGQQEDGEKNPCRTGLLSLLK